jgi:hypothetical protein
MRLVQGIAANFKGFFWWGRIAALDVAATAIKDEGPHEIRAAQ